MIERLKSPGAVDTSIRLATKADALQLAKFRYAFRSSTGTVSENEDEFVERCRLWMEERLREDSPWRCWIAEMDGVLVGHLWIQVIEKIPNPRSESECYAYLTNFYVSDGARGRGIGSRLLSDALDWCKARDVHAVILWPTERSRSLYMRHGFAVREDLLEMPIWEIKV
ncbi:MAG TPA: GNAT family N-acetyltransferase [Pyrinomonadaceae bacterium]|nr:GNAT family N-acetyltransferase [Pyrinomonadaceae bacterium]